MSIPAELTTLVGTWQGTNLLWLSEQPIESEMTAAVKSAAGGTCLCIEYQWNYEGETQEGIILLGSQGPDAVEGIWRDAFHSNASFLISKGKADASNGVQILGSYSAPPGPDWGWRTYLQADGEDRFEITMENISPEEEATLAVRMEFRRSS